MKKSLFTIFFIAICVFLYECRKDPKPDVFKVTEVDVDASYKTAKINGSYTFNVIPNDMKIVYGEKNDLTDAISSKVNVGEDDFHVIISNLKTGTKYYYCFECYSSHSYTRSEIHSFVTLKMDKPIVETVAVEKITQNSASCRGNVTSDGGATVTARGVCWSTSQNPTISDNKTSDGTGTGAFTSQLSNLTRQTTYYVRAYATNEIGTSYGEQKTFTTLEEEPETTSPTVTTSSVSNVTSNSATCGGNVTSDGGAEVTARGICWSTTPNPTINDNKTTNGKGEGMFTSTMTGLTAGTTYYVRAYATNEKGTSYGDEKSFMTSIYMDLPLVTTREIEDITETTAVSGGEVVTDGGAQVIERGVCWSTSQNPSIYDYKTNDGTGTGAFTSQLSDLAPQTTYYVRAYATNAVGTAYGEQRSFMTEEEEPEPTLPTVTTGEVSNITSNSATCGGEVTSDGGTEVTARGVCWSTSQNPTREDNDGITTDGSGIGTFTSQLSNLAPQTTYYVRAYATNEKGTSYGEEKSFSTEEEEEEETSGYINGYEYIDLGLPSGLLWATHNVGATTPEEYGEYYAWGETKTKESYDSYNCYTYGMVINDISGNARYDVARKKWGGSWRIPTRNECEELLNNCQWTWTTQNGIKGCIVKGSNGNSIFLPAAGYRSETSLNSNGEKGQYLCEDPESANDTDRIYSLYFDSELEIIMGISRHLGITVRPVSNANYEETVPTIPTIITSNITYIKSTSAKCGGDVFSDGGAAITAYGVCWSTSQNPTIGDNHTVDDSGIDYYSSTLSPLSPNTTYYVRAYATNENGTSYGDEKSFTTKINDEPTIGTINGYEYVDLDLPSGVKWATCNVGANNSTSYGDYYAWGEVATKTEYEEGNCSTHQVEIGDISGNPQYDVARKKWGSTWRIPTLEEQKELFLYCEWTWTTVNGVNGCIFTSMSNGNSIFLPAAGYRSKSSLIRPGEDAKYYSSTPGDNNQYVQNEWAYYLFFFLSGNYDVGWTSRYNGFPIRPVSE